MSTMANSTPVTAWKALKEGNERFVAGKPQHPSQGIEHRASLAAAQTPNAVVFGCADSRVAAEIIFDQGLGDMTVVRTAGHVIGSAVLGSIEYAVTVLNVPLIVVLGHDSCGAVKATLSALDDGVVPGGYVRDVVERVILSILLGRRDGLTRVDEFEARHVSETAAQLRSRSTAVAERLDAGTLAIAGVTYQLADGRVILRDYLGDIGEGSRSSPDSAKSGSPTVRRPPGPLPEARTQQAAIHLQKVTKSTKSRPFIGAIAFKAVGPDRAKPLPNPPQGEPDDQVRVRLHRGRQGPEGPAGWIGVVSQRSCVQQRFSPEAPPSKLENRQAMLAVTVILNEVVKPLRFGRGGSDRPCGRAASPT